NPGGPQGAERPRQVSRGQERSRTGEVPYLRIRLGRVSNRHRAGLVLSHHPGRLSAVGGGPARCARPSPDRHRRLRARGSAHPGRSLIPCSAPRSLGAVALHHAQSWAACGGDVDRLGAHGVDRAFCVPGESYLAVLDALHDSNAIETIICRHESGAGFMAVGDAKLTGRTGVAFVSRGPGATNASIAVHVAEQDAVPLVLFVGQVPRGEIGRRSFQEVDYAKTFADMAKGVHLVQDPARIPEIVARAFVEAQTPTPGPVVVVLPEDMLEERTKSAVIEPLPVPQAGSPSAAAVAEISRLVAKAERPLLIAGGPGLGTSRGRKALLEASDALRVPVALSFKRQDYFPNGHPHYAGHLGFKIPKAAADRYHEADLILAVGTRLTEVTTQGYTLPACPVPRQPLIHIHDDPRQLGRNYAAVKALAADPVAVLEALAEQPVEASPRRTAWIKKLHEPIAKAMAWAPPADGLLDMGPVVAALVGTLRSDAVLVTD